MMDVTVVVPTYNGGILWKESARRLAEQMPSPLRVKIVDSSSKDDTRDTARGFNFEVATIEQKDFDHGGTRSYALADITTELVVFLTQDALLEGADAISNLVSIFDKEPEVVCVYGRQLPHLDANPLAQHARHNSYKSNSYVTSLAADFPVGFRKSFLSNSFSAYRVDFLRSIGGFPEHLILGEDAYVAARALLDNKKVAYASEACVRHSHNYSAKQEFQRYFDIGVFHSTQSWMIDALGSVEGEGVKFAVDQLFYVCKTNKYLWFIPSIFSSMAKYIGYKLGKKHKRLGVPLSRRLSMYKSYWNRV
ncbi:MULTISPECIES: glycosyltransferase family 2 protein [Marinomonas]|uniref:Glycosyltransferase family 2 protein n=1 Tax=Marinomonas arctica TaxID=383750 RepID=A0A7H1J430_9GAMM|nr:MULTISPECIES: glycosyltransferase [Marinomonas]QNT05246.1 glycosyltransferase family 2 protein [Marinomonas arctica]GGN37390.1 rhamnosyltransferase [Marinomonas arctica]